MEYESLRQVYAKLLAVISNEKESPELLEYEDSAVDCIIEQLQYMVENIRVFKDKLETFCTEQHKSEIDRLQYAVNSYLRIRIQKIEKNCTPLIKLLKSDARRAEKLMSAGEIKYLDSYFVNCEKYLSETILGKMNVPIQDAAHTFSLLELPQDESQLFSTSYVFVKALRQTEVIVDSENGDHDTVKMEPNSIHFLPYSSVRHYILNSSGDVVLM
ncbi:PREDICTED: DNA replication complex GINS protein SLD5-like [Rhagoletis zephyria]|uniref:DNA replication complex GINS protein SLD5-like n=1 Tax=Rhagoletis zephyria TaxID=28612 RepID=UPI0008117213|nr:PREDICTED: DNA replication complex GINS protein SLD5-like [Rhagoletis zephyria]KAH9405029.1 DNA replication complex GINS protein SLD5 [Tyrophagus putrescentiae]